MARSKNRILYVGKLDYGKVITAKVELENGEVVIADYERRAADFNPLRFDADEIAQLAVDAGMKYIVITSKHHDGFAMYHSKADRFNIVDATPFGRDPMRELAEACQRAGIGFGLLFAQPGLDLPRWQRWAGDGSGRATGGFRRLF